MAKKKTTVSKSGIGATLSGPTLRTVKKLFAMSGNRCAFAACKTPIIDAKNGSVLGEICHIKGEKPKAKRYDKSQSTAERHGFDNLILLCPTHHKLVDDDAKTYSTTVLHRIKSTNERKRHRKSHVDIPNELLKMLRLSSSGNGSVIRVSKQFGGQVAHSIKNIYQAKAPPDTIKIEASVQIHGDLTVIQRFGSAGVQLKVINRGTRRANISRAQFCVKGKGFLAAMQRGFGGSLGSDATDKQTELLCATLIPQSKGTHQNGFVLERDDVCCFFLPFGTHIGPALTAKENDVFFRVEFFDGSKQNVVSGKVAKSIIQAAVKAYGDWPYKPRRILKLTVEVTSKTMPKIDFSAIGSTNKNAIWFGDSEPPDNRIELQITLGIARISGKWTISAELNNLPSDILGKVSAMFCVVNHAVKKVYTLELSKLATANLSSQVMFVIPVEQRDKVIKAVHKFQLDEFWFEFRADEFIFFRLQGAELQSVIQALESQLSSSATGAPQDGG